MNLTESWHLHSMNDKGALVNRAAGRDYFTAPLITYSDPTNWKVFVDNYLEEGRKLSPAMYLWELYTMKNITLLRSTPDINILTSIGRPDKMIPDPTSINKNICLRLRLKTQNYNGSWRCYKRTNAWLFDSVIRGMICLDEESLQPWQTKDQYKFKKLAEMATANATTNTSSTSAVTRIIHTP